jgi:hypothetical protein
MVSRLSPDMYIAIVLGFVEIVSLFAIKSDAATSAP